MPRTYNRRAEPEFAGRLWQPRTRLLPRYGFRRQRPIVGGEPHFDPSGAPPVGQNTERGSRWIRS